jgi:putative phosphoesterase
MAMRIAVLSDIHGNSWALDAVLDEVDRANFARVLNLGDCLHGPLDPRGAYERLSERDWPTVRGNQDRTLIEGADDPTTRFVLAELGEAPVAWLGRHTRATVRLDPGILACHGDLEHDHVTLIERVEPTHVRRATDAELAAALAGAGEDVEIVLCGHSHQPGMVRLANGLLAVNPGSVGLPAYDGDAPYSHVMESGTPHARWAILERTASGWGIEFRATPYDTRPAVAAARANGRPDWAQWIMAGRATPT